MNWEQTIEYIRNNPEYRELVDFAYLDKNLKLNVERFRQREEFKETLKIIKTHAPFVKRILDIGCGNGISAISLALEGYHVTAVEPDPSYTIGANAILQLVEIYQLQNRVNVIVSTSEELEEVPLSFDVVYIRQAMHHAINLNKFVSNAVKYLKQGGLFLTIRDHLIFSETDKKWFLNSHPLHKFYHGENAYTLKEYRMALSNGGLDIVGVLKYFDSPINYYPSKSIHEELVEKKKYLLKKYGPILVNFLSFNVYAYYKKMKMSEKKVPGRVYSFICIKK